MTRPNDLVGASRRKLELWGISAKQIDAAGANRTQPVVPTITMYAAATGSVVERKVTHGQYVNAGDTLFTVADLSTVWVKADVYESQLPRDDERDRRWRSRRRRCRTRRFTGTWSSSSQPPIRRRARCRCMCTWPIPGCGCVPGMFVRAKFISRGERDTLLVPRSAVLDTGTRKLVYVAKADGVFEAREVEVGAPSEDAYPVLRGVKEGEKVVTSGNFLIDSQTRLSGGMSGLFGGSKEYGGHKQNGQPSRRRRRRTRA